MFLVVNTVNTVNIAMIAPFKIIERRSDKRLELSLPITFLDLKARSKNISCGGVYFEVETDDVKLFSPEKKITLEVVANSYIPWQYSKTIKLTGRGVVIRTEQIEKPGCANGKRIKKLGIALKFVEKLTVMYSKL